MLGLLKEIIMGFNKREMTDLDISKIVPVLEALLSINEYSVTEMNTIQIMLSYLDDFEDDIRNSKVLQNMILELKLKIKRIGFNNIEQLTAEYCEPEKELVNNLQVYSLIRGGDHKKVDDYRFYSDGTYDKETIFSIHPELDFESEFPIFNDYAQAAFNKLDGKE